MSRIDFKDGGDNDGHVFLPQLNVQNEISLFET